MVSHPTYPGSNTSKEEAHNSLLNVADTNIKGPNLVFQMFFIETNRIMKVHLFETLKHICFYTIYFIQNVDH